jgi:hypothetical protein
MGRPNANPSDTQDEQRRGYNPDQKPGGQRTFANFAAAQTGLAQLLLDLKFSRADFTIFITAFALGPVRQHLTATAIRAAGHNLSSNFSLARAVAISTNGHTSLLHHKIVA